MSKNLSGSAVDKIIKGARSLDKLVEESESRLIKKSTRGRPKTKPDSLIEVNATFLFSKKNLEAVKALAHLRRLHNKTVLNQIIEIYLETNREELKTALEIYRKDMELQEEAKRKATEEIN